VDSEQLLSDMWHSLAPWLHRCMSRKVQLQPC